jgi:hypothetical protein
MVPYSSKNILYRYINIELITIQQKKRKIVVNRNTNSDSFRHNSTKYNFVSLNDRKNIS